MKKRLIAMFIMLCMAVTMVAPASAVSSNVDKFISTEINPIALLSDYYGDVSYENTLVKKVNNDLTILGQFGFKGLNTEINVVKSNGTVVYKVELLDDLVNYIDISQSSNGSINLHFVEENTENNVTIGSNGEILLDGHTVRITNYYEEEKAVIPEGSASIKAGVHRYYQNGVPAGTIKSEYNTTGSVYQSTTKIDFDVNMGSLAVGAIVTILTAGLATKTCVMYSLVSGVSFNTVANWLKNTNPYYQYASFKDIKCSRPKDSVVYHYKHDVYIWNKKDYQGAKKLLETYYEIVEPT